MYFYSLKLMRGFPWLFISISYLLLQSEKSKKAGNAPPTTSLVDFLRTSYEGCSDIHLLEEDMNFNSRAASLSVSVIHSAVDKCEK